MSSFSFAATGDAFITRALPANDPHRAQLAALIGSADFRFTNLETTLRRNTDGFPSAQSGGTWATTSPEVLGDLLAYGFNAVAWANNHTLDYSYGALSSTRRALDAAGVAHAGAGETLSEAAAVRYVETPQGRIAFIAATTTFHESWIAGNPRLEVPGRPGVNPLRFTLLHRINAERLAALKAAAELCHINARHNLSVKEGFALPDAEGVVRLGDLLFTEAAPGETEGSVSAPHAGDLARLLASVEEARRQADAVVVSIHSHEMKEDAKDRPADFLSIFARKCIDHGAHAVIGHGPHIVRAVEVYQNRPIFYSLGNFIFQNETIATAPADFYQKYGLGADATLADLFDKRSHNDTKGFAINPRIWESVVATWRMEAGELRELTLHPISLGHGEPRHRKGWPRLTDNPSPLEDIRRLSAEFGTEITLSGGLAHWRPA